MDILLSEETIQMLATYLLIFAVVLLIIYIAIGIFLNKLNKLVYGKGTPMAFIPILNIYLLGKLTVGKPIGLVLVLIPILLGEFTTNVNGIENTYTLLPSSISNKISLLINIIIFGLFIYSIFLYFKLKKEKNNKTNIENQEISPLEDKNKDMINNIINATKENDKITTPISNIESKEEVKTDNTSNTIVNEKDTNIVNSNINNNNTNNNEPTELMKQYQNDNLNN